MLVDLSWGRVGDDQPLTFAGASKRSFYVKRDRLLFFKLNAEHSDDLILSKRQTDLILRDNNSLNDFL